MTKTLTPARLVIREDGTPFSAEFGDVYHSIDGGPGQAEFVFLAGNGLPERWRHRHSFTVLETGFGTGLNFLATWKAWLTDSARCFHLRFVSIEKHPFGADDLGTLHQRWPELALYSEQLCAAWPLPETGLHTLQFDQGRVTLDLHFGDAADVLPRLKKQADAFYLDGFAPGKNPEMWSPAIFQALAAAATPGATLATWTVAATVRKGLAEAGFSLWKSAGYGRKREMLRGALRGDPSPDRGSRD
ncbi:MAG: tRNA (5-methylaminomethyl-2-thiouridine)(34)-methyltransferase MnmD [Rhodocyclaceae bacterium]